MVQMVCNKIPWEAKVVSKSRKEYLGHGLLITLGIRCLSKVREKVMFSKLGKG